MTETIMADHLGMAAVGLSLVRLLNLHFDGLPPLTAGSRTKAVLMRTEEMDPANRTDAMTAPMVSLFLYRVDINRVTRPGWSAVGHQDDHVHLPLDLHYLLTPWASNAEFEYQILGQAMTCLEQTPILSGPMLYPSASWDGSESVQLCVPEMTTEDLMRTFDSLPVNYKLSIPYLARIVRIDSRENRAAPPVHHAIIGSKPEVSP
jgi:hypothetical protein